MNPDPNPNPNRNNPNNLLDTIILLDTTFGSGVKLLGNVSSEILSGSIVVFSFGSFGFFYFYTSMYF